MPQDIRVLCCFKCKIFQVDIVKKANRWKCKMCGEKQSVFKEFLRGTGAECRQKVQELNFSRNVEKHKEGNELLDLLEQNDIDVDLELVVKEEIKHTNHAKKSKWTEYVDDTKENCEKFIEVRPHKSTEKIKSDCNNTRNECAKSSSRTGSKWDPYL